MIDYPYAYNPPYCNNNLKFPSESVTHHHFLPVLDFITPYIATYIQFYQHKIMAQQLIIDYCTVYNLQAEKQIGTRLKAQDKPIFLHICQYSLHT